MNPPDAVSAWAPSGLRIEAGDLLLTPVEEADLPALVDLVLGGVHAPEAMPFAVPWTDAPRAELPQRFAAYHRANRASFTADDLRLDLTVRRGGEVVGMQGFSATDYPLLRTAETGSWLGLPHQGQGIGTRMRQAVCAFLVDCLGARRILSGAWADNPASLAVSRKVGYVDNGLSWRVRGGVEVAHRHLLLEPSQLERGEPVVVSGSGALRALLGISE